MNWASASVGAKLVDFSSQVFSGDASNVLDDDHRRIWLTEDGTPQWLCISLLKLADVKNLVIRTVGWYCWRSYSTNPKIVNMHVSTDGSKFKRWDSFVARGKGKGSQLFSCAPVDVSLYPFVALEVTETFGGAQAYMNRVYLYSDEISPSPVSSVSSANQYHNLDQKSISSNSGLQSAHQVNISDLSKTTAEHSIYYAQPPIPTRPVFNSSVRASHETDALVRQLQDALGIPVDLNGSFEDNVNNESNDLSEYNERIACADTSGTVASRVAALETAVNTMGHTLIEHLSCSSSPVQARSFLNESSTSSACRDVPIQSHSPSRDKHSQPGSSNVLNNFNDRMSSLEEKFIYLMDTLEKRTEQQKVSMDTASAPSNPLHNVKCTSSNRPLHPPPPPPHSSSTISRGSAPSPARKDSQKLRATPPSRKKQQESEHIHTSDSRPRIEGALLKIENMLQHVIKNRSQPMGRIHCSRHRSSRSSPGMVHSSSSESLTKSSAGGGVRDYIRDNAQRLSRRERVDRLLQEHQTESEPTGINIPTRNSKDWDETAEASSSDETSGGAHDYLDRNHTKRSAYVAKKMDSNTGDLEKSIFELLKVKYGLENRTTSAEANSRTVRHNVSSHQPKSAVMSLPMCSSAKSADRDGAEVVDWGQYVQNRVASRNASPASPISPLRPGTAGVYTVAGVVVDRADHIDVLARAKQNLRHDRRFRESFAPLNNGSVKSTTMIPGDALSVCPADAVEEGEEMEQLVRTLHAKVLERTIKEAQYDMLLIGEAEAKETASVHRRVS